MGLTYHHLIKILNIYHLNLKKLYPFRFGTLYKRNKNKRKQGAKLIFISSIFKKIQIILLEQI